MEIVLSSSMQLVLKTLERNGYDAYIVGGYIRDSIIGDTSKSDVDILTCAKIEEIKKIFSEYKIVEYKNNKKTIGVVIDKSYFEISSYDGETLKENLENRDFTMNSMVYNPKIGLLDYFGGVEDINNKIIRTLKDPLITLCYNPIRILRAIKFEIELGFTVSNDLYDEINHNSNLLNSEKSPRYKKYFEMIIMQTKPSIYIRKYFNVVSTIIPALKDTYGFEQHSKWHNLDVFEHIMKVLDFTKPILILRLAAFFHDIEKPKCFSMDDDGVGHFYNHFIDSAETAKFELASLGYSNDIVNRVYNLVLYHDRRLEPRQVVLTRFIKDFGTKDLDLYFDLKKADCLGQNPELYGRIKEIDVIKEMTFSLVKKLEEK